MARECGSDGETYDPVKGIAAVVVVGEVGLDVVIGD